MRAPLRPPPLPQVESTLSLQALQPRVKELQAKFANDPENLQLETARLYRDAGVNPLAGCLPTLATIPVFIGLYQALTKAANDGLLKDSFFWIPSLGGPVSLEDQKGVSGSGNVVGGVAWQQRLRLWSAHTSNAYICMVGPAGTICPHAHARPE